MTSSYCRRPLAHLCRRHALSSRGAWSTTTTTRLFSTNLNHDNMSQYHKEASHIVIPPQEWTQYHGKISVLKTEGDKELSSSQAAPFARTRTERDLYGDKPRVSVLMELTDRLGVLHDVLKYFWKYDINVTRIESRPVAPSSQWGGDKKPKFDFYMDFDGSVDDPTVRKLFQDLGPLTAKLLVLDEKDVHWFPRHISELDSIAHRTLDAGVDLESDHPGFHDQVYRERRAELANNAIQHSWDRPIPQIEYTKEETETWGAVWDRMEDLWKKHACKEYLVSCCRMDLRAGKVSLMNEQTLTLRYSFMFQMFSIPFPCSSKAVDTVATTSHSSEISVNFSKREPISKCDPWRDYCPVATF
jgi:hypothetical protein